MARLFGTDGVRGIANRELDCKLAFLLGQAGARVLAQGGETPTILIGADTRQSGTMLCAALAAGICSTGAQAVLAGVLPTPGIAYLVRKLGMDAGVVVSASHNPAEYNGIKFFSGNGFKLPDEVEDAIEACMQQPMEEPPVGGRVGTIRLLEDGVQLYADFLRAQGNDLSGMKVALDCANGAASAIAPALFQSLGAEVVAAFNRPDGVNINDACGSTYPEQLKALVLESGADIGLAFDGDADRLIACDDKGEIVDGDVILGILARDMKRQGELKNDTLVVTVMSNMGLELAMQKEGILLKKTAVGDRYVLEEMLRSDAVLGGEQSGHVIMTDRSTAGDGMQTAIRLCNVLAAAKQPLHELCSFITILPQVLVNAKVLRENTGRYMEDPAVREGVHRLEEKYAGNGRVLIRPSGTEPKIRVMIEGTDLEQMQADAKALAELMEARLKG